MPEVSRILLYNQLLFPSDLFIQPGDNKPVISDDLSKEMINLYTGTGIFASEEPVRKTTKRLVIQGFFDL